MHPWTTPVARHNLPTQITPLVGREAEIAAVRLRLLQANVHLLTLTGPPGVGKTRLGFAVADALSRDFGDGVCYVPLAPVTNPQLVPLAIAHAVGVRDGEGQPIFDQLRAALSDKAMLLLLDNFEQVAEAAPFVAALLAAAPQLKALLTSRIAAHVSGEHEFPVPPLPFPNDDRLPASGDGRVAAIASYPAVALFVQRAQAVNPNFALTEANAAPVAAICRRLDGIPLALELAAARIKLFPPPALLARLGQRLPLLTGGARDLPERQRTLRGAIDWSYSLLADEGQRIFRRLATFVGGFTVEAAEAVCAGDEGTALDGLAALLDGSLVQQTGDEIGEARFAMLELIREYAEERLMIAGEATPTRERHAAHFLALAEQAEPELIGSTQQYWFARLESEHDNVRAALRWLLDRGAGAPMARLASSLWIFWLVRGHLTEGRRWLNQALALPFAEESIRAQALAAAGIMATRQHDHIEAGRLLAESLRLYEALGEQHGIAEVSNMLGTTAHDRGDDAQATEHFERSLPLYRATGDRRGVALALNHLATIALDAGEVDRAAALSDESLALCRAVGDVRTLAGALMNRGMAALAQGDETRAASLCEEGLALRRTLGDKGGMAHSLAVLGQTALAAQDASSAFAHYTESLRLRREIDDGAGIIVALRGLAATLATGTPEDQERAVELRAATETFAAPSEQPAPTNDDSWLVGLRDRLGAAAFDTAWQVGAQHFLDDALALAAEPPLANPAPAPADSPSPAATTELRIAALGPLRVEVGGRTLDPGDWTYARAKELLVYLACHPPVTKEQIGLAFWPDASPAQLRSNLHPVIHHLRRALGNHGWITFERQGYALANSRPWWFDVTAFESALTAARQSTERDPAHARATLETAVDLYRGDFLADLDAGEWHLPRREALRLAYHDALLLLGHLQAGSDDHAVAAATYRRAIAHDGSLETAHRELLRCYARLGERGRALRHYQQLVAHLRDEFGIAPEPETAALYDRLRAGEDV